MHRQHFFISIATLLLASAMPANAQNRDDFEKFRQQSSQRFNTFQEKKQKDYEDFRRKRNEDFAQFMRRSWTQFQSSPLIPAPKDNEVEPVEVTPQKEEENAEPKPLAIEEIIPAPLPKPQPQPVEPIAEVVTPPKQQPQPTHKFTFFGTEGSVRLDTSSYIHLDKLSEDDVADAWLKLSETGYTNLVYDCLQLRKKLQLCDWAYLHMLKGMAESVFQNGSNEATLLMAYVYCQSGYKMRLAYDDQHLYMLFASEHLIFDWDYYIVDGEVYYPVEKSLSGTIHVCTQSYPKEQTMSLLIPEEPLLAMKETDAKKHATSTALAHPVSATCTSNQNLLDFYSSYPTSTIANSVPSRWAMYANMPMPEHIRKELYPQLQQAISGLGKKDAANCILTWIHKAFTYEYDDKVWGYDRAFFPEETLYYPYCDCEDRSILYTRILRDLLHLDCILVFYPGHLACAVRFDEDVAGDYILLNGQRYVVADPTYFGAKVGMTMPGMDNKQAQVVLLK